MFRDLVPGRIRRGVEFAAVVGVVVLEFTGVAAGGSWTSGKGGGEGRRGEVKVDEGLSEVDEEAIFVFDGPNDIR